MKSGFVAATAEACCWPACEACEKRFGVLEGAVGVDVGKLVVGVTLLRGKKGLVVLEGAFEVNPANGPVGVALSLGKKGVFVLGVAVIDVAGAGAAGAGVLFGKNGLMKGLLVAKADVGAAVMAEDVNMLD